MLQAIADMGVMPKALQRKPELYEDLRGTWDGYLFLAGARVMGSGIPATEIEDYCRLTGIDRTEDRMEFMRYVRALDAVWIKHKEAKAKQKSGNTIRGT